MQPPQKQQDSPKPSAVNFDRRRGLTRRVTTQADSFGQGKDIRGEIVAVSGSRPLTSPVRGREREQVPEGQRRLTFEARLHHRVWEWTASVTAAGLGLDIP